ncbi:MAG: hypothetical protein ACRDDL_01140 [Sarcina sp.]
MNKKYLSVLIIVVTIVISTIMIINSKKLKYNDLIQVKKENVTKKDDDEINKNINNSNLEEVLDLIENLEKELNTTNLKEENEEVQIEHPKTEMSNNETGSLVNETEKQVDESKEESIEVFKVDKTTIVEKLSFDEKLLLLNLTKELSMNDYATIIKSIKNKGELECVREVNRILESRLNTKNYESIKKVVEPYINMEVLE